MYEFDINEVVDEKDFGKEDYKENDDISQILKEHSGEARKAAAEEAARLAFEAHKSKSSEYKYIIC